MEAQITQAFSPEDFRKHGHHLIDLLADHLSKIQSADHKETIAWEAPNDLLRFWQGDINGPLLDNPGELFENILSKSINLYSPTCMGHQVPPPAPAAVLGA